MIGNFIILVIILFFLYAIIACVRIAWLDNRERKIDGWKQLEQKIDSLIGEIDQNLLVIDKALSGEEPGDLENMTISWQHKLHAFQKSLEPEGWEGVIGISTTTPPLKNNEEAYTELQGIIF